MKLIILFILSLISTALSCGCYGSNSCDLSNSIARCTDEGVCDCCAACNSCPQIQAGCGPNDANGYFSPSVPSYIEINSSVTFVVEYNLPGGGTLYPIYANGAPCVRPNLPSGLSIITIPVPGSADHYAVSGAPTEIVPPTTYTLAFYGPTANYITRVSFTTSIVQTTTGYCETYPHATTGGISSQSCTDLGYMRCDSQTTFQTCANAAGGGTAWTQSQPCAPTTSCNTNGNYIYCQ